LRMNSSELLRLLENAIDTSPSSEYHSGFTAKEIHRKCFVHIQLLDQENTTLREMLENCKDTKTFYLGWGKGKDE
jgi:hypothetical protein